MSTEEKSDSILDQVKDTVAAVSEKITEVKESLINEEILIEYKSMGTDAAQKIITQLNDSKDIISKSGYELKDIEIDIAIPPQVILIFHFSREIDFKEKEELLSQAQDRRIVSLVLKGLFKANDLYNSVKIGHYKMDSVEIGIGLIPDIKIVLSAN